MNVGLSALCAAVPHVANEHRKVSKSEVFVCCAGWWLCRCCQSISDDGLRLLQLSPKGLWCLHVQHQSLDCFILFCKIHLYIALLRHHKIPHFFGCLNNLFCKFDKIEFGQPKIEWLHDWISHSWPRGCSRPVLNVDTPLRQWLKGTFLELEVQAVGTPDERFSQAQNCCYSRFTSL